MLREPAISRVIYTGYRADIGDPTSHETVLSLEIDNGILRPWRGILDALACYFRLLICLASSLLYLLRYQPVGHHIGDLGQESTHRISLIYPEKLHNIQRA